MILHIFFILIGLLGILEGIGSIKNDFKKRGWTSLIAGVIIIFISLYQLALYLFFDWPSNSFGIWSSKFIYNITILISGIIFFFFGVNLLKNERPEQKIRGIGLVIIGALMAILYFLEILLG